MVRVMRAVFPVLLAAAGQVLVGTASDAVVIAGEPQRSHVTQAGIEIAMPAIATMSCFEMRRALDRIDQSGYRGNGLLMEDHPDFPLFVYEDRLASSFYLDCTLRRSKIAQPTDVFSRGFNAD